MGVTGSGEIAGFTVDSRVHGTFRPAGSKSLAQRALLASALAEGETELANLSDAYDVLAARDLLADLEIVSEPSGPGGVRIRGVPPRRSGGLRARGALEVGESGTLARLASGALALASRPGEHWTIAARGSLLFRKSLPLFRALAGAGVELRRQNLPGTWPVELVSAAPPARLVLLEPVSSQEVSALLLALSAHAEARELSVSGRIPSAPYLRMTLGVLALFGARVTELEAGQGERRFRVEGPLLAPRAPLVLEPDASSAAVLLAAACLSGGEVRVPGLARASLQGDVRIVEHLQAFGCAARHEGDALVARGFPARGAELDLSGEPDLAPVLCALAAAVALHSGDASVLRGLATLPGKESDRLACLAQGLAALGLALEPGVDSLRIAPGSGPTEGELLLDPRGDHRMAFAFALLGLLRPGVLVRDAACVRKSWGSFWSDMEGLGAVVTRAG